MVDSDSHDPSPIFLVTSRSRLGLAVLSAVLLNLCFPLAGPLPVKEGPAAGQTILYFLAPWGMQLELITYPHGMAYEKTAKVKLWSPTAPGE